MEDEACEAEAGGRRRRGGTETQPVWESKRATSRRDESRGARCEVRGAEIYFGAAQALDARGGFIAGLICLCTQKPVGST